MKTVLVVDDDPDLRRMYATLIAKRGYEVIARESAEDLVALVVASEPVAILIDLMMPGIDGLEAVEQLRRDPRTRPVRVIMLSACHSFEAARRSSELAVERYLVKPATMDAVLAAIDGRSPERARAGACR